MCQPPVPVAFPPLSHPLPTCHLLGSFLLMQVRPRYPPPTALLLQFTFSLQPRPATPRQDRAQQSRSHWPLHPRQNPSISPFLHGDSAANAFLPSVLQNSRLPHLPRQIATMTLLPHPERAQLSSCHAIYLNHMSMLLPLQRSHEVNKRHHFPGKSRVSPSSRH